MSDLFGRVVQAKKVYGVTFRMWPDALWLTKRQADLLREAYPGVTDKFLGMAIIESEHIEPVTVGLLKWRPSYD